MADWLTKEGLAPLIVSNGMDVRASVESWELPAALKSLPRPIVGYCGSLTHRIDWDLIEAVSVARPDWSIVLIGEPAKDERSRQVVARPNVHALGVLPYETALRHVAAFDAAMIPHLRSPLSQHMIRLKLYVYRGWACPWSPPPSPISTISRAISASRHRRRNSWSSSKRRLPSAGHVGAFIRRRQ